jgi:Tol biopolymer transport system component
MRRAAFLAAIALGAFAGTVSAGSYTPPPGDCCPQWSPNGTQVVFTTNRAPGSHGAATVGVVGTHGGKEQFVAGIPVGARSPDWKHVVYTVRKNGATWLAVANVDGSNEVLLAETNADFAWAPDSSRLVFVANNGSLDVVGIDGKNPTKIAPGPAGMPAWSPNGKRIAYVSPPDNGNLHLVDATGGGDTKLAGPAGAIEPAWSRDSTRVAFVVGNAIVVARPGGSARTYPLPAPPLLNNGFFPDGRAVLYDAEATLPAGLTSAEIGTLVGGRLFQDALVRLDLATGKSRVLSFGVGAEFSRDRKALAFSSGGECRDRTGAYVMRVDGSGRRRVSNDCSIRGTAGPDRLHGTALADVLLGLGGNDRLVANDPGYVGDTLDGGPGNDVLAGGFRQDTLYGGPGDDTLNGGPSGDALIGAPGHDHLNGQGGNDTIDARDGQRDVVTCGGGRDTVLADRVDSVASDCEVVRRS